MVIAVRYVGISFFVVAWMIIVGCGGDTTPTVPQSQESSDMPVAQKATATAKPPQATATPSHMTVEEYAKIACRGGSTETRHMGTVAH